MPAGFTTGVIHSIGHMNSFPDQKQSIPCHPTDTCTGKLGFDNLPSPNMIKLYYVCSWGLEINEANKEERVWKDPTVISWTENGVNHKCSSQL